MWDTATGKSRGYGFVSFRDRADSEKAMSMMNGAMLGKKPVRINWAHQRGAAAVGNIASLSASADHQEAGKARIVKPSRVTVTYKQVVAQSPTQHSTVYVGNIPQGVSADDIKPLFQEYGHILELHTHLDKGFLFMKMDTHQNAATAIMNLTGTTVNGARLRISWGKDKEAEQLYYAQQQYLQAAAAGGYGGAASGGYAGASGSNTGGYDANAYAQYYAQQQQQQQPQMDAQTAAYYAQYYAQIDPQTSAYYAQYAQQLQAYQQQQQQQQRQ